MTYTKLPTVRLVAMAQVKSVWLPATAVTEVQEISTVHEAPDGRAVGCAQATTLAGGIPLTVRNRMWLVCLWHSGMFLLWLGRQLNMSNKKGELCEKLRKFSGKEHG
jgi:hypothetical protein